MKKYLSLIIVLLVLASALICQWFRADKTVARLDARIQKLTIELIKIDEVKKRGITTLDEKMAESVNVVDDVRRRLPFILDEYSFADELIERFEEKNIEVQYFYSFWESTDFYQQADLTFSLDFQDYNEASFQEIFDSFDRLLHWAVFPQNQTLVVSIYSLSFDFTPYITSCSAATKKNLNYWPFNSLVQDREKLIYEKCKEKDESEWLLRKIRYFEKIHEYIEVGVSIIKQLDPDWKLKEGSKVGD